MENVMKKLKIKDEYIKLGQAMKLAGLVSSGLEAKLVILNGEVSVNNETCLMRGKKLYIKDCFEYDNQVFKIE